MVQPLAVVVRPLAPVVQPFAAVVQPVAAVVQLLAAVVEWWKRSLQRCLEARELTEQHFGEAVRH
jgi:hypothetical protein